MNMFKISLKKGQKRDKKMQRRVGEPGKMLNSKLKRDIRKRMGELKVTR